MSYRTGKRADLKKIFPVEFDAAQTEKEIIRLCIEKAYNDAARTFSGINPDQKTSAFNDLVCCFSKYFDDPVKCKEEFDGWHKKACSLLCEQDKRFSNKDTTYGQAQKIVNMTFKYLYCSNEFVKCKGFDENKYDEFFKFCHMPLDSYTLSWFADTFGGKDGIASASKIKDMSWSKLEYDSTKNCCLSYKKIQCTIRKCFESDKCKEEYKGLTPFQAEFYIWQEEKAKAALKDLLKAAGDLQHISHDTYNEVILNNDNYKNCNEDLKKFIAFIKCFFSPKVETE